MPKSQGFKLQTNQAVREELGRGIEQALRKAGMTRTQLAEALEVTPPTVTGWIKGSHAPTFENLWRIAVVTKVATADLLPSPLPEQSGMRANSLRLGAALGPRLVSALLRMPSDRLVRDVRALLGAYAADQAAE